MVFYNVVNDKAKSECFDIPFRVNGSNIYLVKPDYDFNTYKNFIRVNESIFSSQLNLDKIINLMLSDDRIKNLFCLNLNNFIKNDDKFSYLFHMEGQKTYLKKINLFQDETLELNEELEYFSNFSANIIFHLASFYSAYTDIEFNFYEHIIEPIKLVLDEINFEYNLYNDFIEITDSRLLNLEYLWCNAIIFENYIKALFELEGFDISDNSIILYNPKVKKDLKVCGCFEIDILAKKDNLTYLVECKNGKISQNEYFKFLGKVKTFKEVYNLKVVPLMIASNWKFFGLNRLKTNITICDFSDFKNNYSYLRNFLRNNNPKTF